MADRTILHSDLNSFYASVEIRNDPALAGQPVAVGGDEQARHGIVLAAQPARQAAWHPHGPRPSGRARRKCPELVIVRPHFDEYARFSQAVRQIYLDYTSQIEPMSLDEAFLDVTGSRSLFGDGEAIAHTIRRRVKRELGLTVSVGVSFNKIFAKLGSDYKKPDAVTVFSRENYRALVWPQPAANLLYVGRATAKKLAGHRRAHDRRPGGSRSGGAPYAARAKWGPCCTPTPTAGTGRPWPSTRRGRRPNPSGIW